ncbi:MAG TPA: hypothetical protein VGB14_20645 [Acidimicrobiales bacterium]|jgi:hypothetical protein
MSSEQQMQDLVAGVMGEMTALEAEYALEPSAFDRTDSNEVAWYIAYKTNEQ